MAARRPKTGRDEANEPSSLLVEFGPDKPLELVAGVKLSPFQVAYQTYGELNAKRSNAVLICHALTGDQYVASENPITHKPGWWEVLIGPRQNHRHGQVFCHLPKRHRLLPRLHRPRVDQPQDRQGLWH
jgi:homoserine acetyltransferase